MDYANFRTAMSISLSLDHGFNIASGGCRMTIFPG